MSMLSSTVGPPFHWRLAISEDVARRGVSGTCDLLLMFEGRQHPEDFRNMFKGQGGLLF